MPEPNLFALSIHTPYVDEIRAGRKKFELRKYRTGIQPGDWVAAYETLPTGAVSTVFQAGGTIKEDPEEFWNWFQEDLGIEREPYFAYLAGKQFVHAIEIVEVRTFEPILLSELREDYRFNPPQGCVGLRGKVHPRIIEAIT